MTLVETLRYMGRQYAAGQQARGGSTGKHYLEEAADEIERAQQAMKSVRYSVNITRACLLDSVETHGTHGGWLHEEAKRLDTAIDELDEAMRQGAQHE
jgi:hypothetical protein